MTGLAIVFYLNQTPSQPRERDYAYAGSFYAFAIWCGLGVAAIIDWLKKLKLQPVAVATVVSAFSPSSCLFRWAARTGTTTTVQTATHAATSDATTS